MKQIFRLIFLIHLTSRSTSFTVQHHTCVSSIFELCILDHVFYHPTLDIIHVFPKNHTHFRIESDMWSKGHKSVIQKCDAEFYQALGQPKTLEIMNAQMETLEIPRQLVFGNFVDNRLETFNVEAGSAEPKLTYLDLGRNTIVNLTNIASLVNLESLYLYGNDIKTLDSNLFKDLTKLQLLNLNFNSIDRIVGDQLPQSLTFLGLYQNQLKTLNYNSFHLASLEILNVERNKLKTIDASTVIAVMPKLKEFRLSRMYFSRDGYLNASKELGQYNITLKDITDEVSCYADEELIEGVCKAHQVLQPQVQIGWIQTVLLSLLVLLTVMIIFLLLVRKIFHAINK